MDDLRDMGRFPLPIYVGATANVLMTVLMTYLIRGRSGNPLVPPVWAGGVIFANLAPALALRPRMNGSTSYPEIREMGLSADQHKFSSWVYAVASANMPVWIFLSWSLFSYRRDRRTLAGMLILVSVCTLFRALVRLFRHP
jgi:hypothetical protein